MSNDDIYVGSGPDGSIPDLGPMRMPVFTTALASDAMYYNAARRSLEQARVAKAAVDAAHVRWRVLEERERQAEAAGDYDEWERLAITMVDHEDGRMAELYGPYIEALAAVHVMAASALEAHVNERGAEKLTGKEWEYFDKLSLEGKWLFLPRLLQRAIGFDIGAQPFQGFARLVRARNDLLHHKPRREEWRAGRAPAFLAKLALTLEDAEASVGTAAAMIEKLAELLGKRSPYWLRRSNYLAFSPVIEDSDE